MAVVGRGKVKFAALTPPFGKGRLGGIGLKGRCLAVPGEGSKGIDPRPHCWKSPSVLFGKGEDKNGDCWEKGEDKLKGWVVKIGNPPRSPFGKGEDKLLGWVVKVGNPPQSPFRKGGR